METNNGKQGGIFEGKSHTEGGIKGVVVDTQQSIEVEGEEALLPKETMTEQKELTVKGTPAEIIDHITEATTGTPASDIKVTDKTTAIKVESGQAIINKRTMAMEKEITAQGTPCEIASELNELGGGVKFTCDNVYSQVSKVNNYKRGGNVSKSTDVYNLPPSKAKKAYGDFEAFYSDVVHKIKPTVEYYTGNNNNIRSYYNVLDNELLVDTVVKQILTFNKINETVVPDVIVYDNEFYRELAKKYSAKISKEYIDSPNPNARVLVFKNMRDALFFLYDSEFAEQQKHILSKAKSIADEVKEENMLGGAGDYQTLNTLAEKHQVGITEVYKQLQKGILHELEHTTNKAIAEETAKDHLVEDIYYYEKLPVVEQLTFEEGGEIDSEQSAVIDISNVFYSPLKKAISDSKFEKMPAKHWADKFGNGEEAKAIGLKEWLHNQKQGSITKQEIINYIKENEVQVSVVVKSVKGTFEKVEDAERKYGVSIYLEEDEFSGTPRVEISGINLDLTDEQYEKYTQDIKSYILEGNDSPPKYDQYVLPGDSDGYKEVLIVLDTDKPRDFENDIVSVEQDSYGDWVVHTKDKVKWRMPDAKSKEEALKQFEEKVNSGQYGKRKTIANKEVYASRHWDELNVILHLRFNTRIDVHGQKVLFIEEIQSDWAQDGRRQGFKKKDSLTREQIRIEKNNFDDKVVAEFIKNGVANDKKGVFDWYYDKNFTPAIPIDSVPMISLLRVEGKFEKKGIPVPMWFKKLQNEEDELGERWDYSDADKLANAPFVTDTNEWVKLGLKYALIFAIEQNVRYLAWINGDQQNERYALAKHVKSIQYAKRADDLYILSVTDIAGNEIKYNTSMSLKEIEEYIGKDIADKIKDNFGQYKAPLHRSLSDFPEILTIEGEGLKVGGKGMIDFYGSLYQFKSTIEENKDRIDFTLNKAVAETYFYGGTISEDLPLWAKNEMYLANIENKGEKGDGKTVIEEVKEKAKQLGADILTLRADMGLGFGGTDSKLYKYYKDLGFQDNDLLNPDGRMYFDLRKYQSKGSLGIVGNVLKALVKQVAGYTPTIETLYIPSEALKLDAIQYDGTQDVSMLPGNFYLNEGNWIVLQDGEMIWFDEEARSKREAIDMFKNIAAEADMQVAENPEGMLQNKGIRITNQLKASITNGGIPIFEQGGEINNISESKVNTDIVFYSPLEKAISDSKVEKMPAKHWADKFGNGEEAKWTGLAEWLGQKQEFAKTQWNIKPLRNGKFRVTDIDEKSAYGIFDFDTEKQAKDFANGTVSKTDTQQYLKDNRIQIVEVVKGKVDYDAKNKNLSYEGNGDFIFLKDSGKKTNYEIRKKKLGYYDIYDGAENIGTRATLEEAKELAEANYNAENGNPQIDKSAEAKFEGYQLEGQKENYKEILVTMPNSKRYNIVHDSGKIISKHNSIEEAKDTYFKLPKSEQYKHSILPDESYERNNTANKINTFKSTHFDEANILVHLRMNTRKDSESKKVLFLEEIQSDWAQQGRRQGFSEKAVILTPENTKVVLSTSGQSYILLKDGLQYADMSKETGDGFSKQDLHSELIHLANKYGKNEEARKTPTAPFVTDTNEWVKLGLKVALKEAINQGADKLAWTTGEQQISRYDLSKEVDEVRYFKSDNPLRDRYDYEIYAYKDGKNVIDKYLYEKELEGVLGKEISEKIINNKGDKYQAENGKVGGSISGEGLKVGSKGMIDFYDIIVPNVLKAIVKQIAGYIPTIETLYIPLAAEKSKESMLQNKGISITNELKTAITNNGIPIFEQGGEILI